MIAAIAVVCVAVFALFIWAAIAGNRAQTRMVERDAAARELRDAAARDKG